jgi:hypothetical protein
MDAGLFRRGFFRWHNEEQRHSGLALLTPAMVRYHQTAFILEQRQTVLDSAWPSAARHAREHEPLAATILPEKNFPEMHGLVNACRKLQELAKRTTNECFAIYTPTRQIVVLLHIAQAGQLRAMRVVFQIAYDEHHPATRSELLRAQSFMKSPALIATLF